MAQLIRKPETDTISMPSPGEEIRWTESFLYVDDVAKSAWEVVEDALVPKQGERRSLGGLPSNGFNNSFICRSIDITPVPASKLAWNVRVTWGSRRPKFDQGQGDRPWFKITRSTQQRTLGIYRTGAAIWQASSGVDAEGNAPYPPAQWIQGDKVDVNGQPLVVKISQQLIQVDFLWDRTLNEANAVLGGAAASPDPPSEWTSEYVNSRNDTAFLGWPAGYVTYLGWSANHANEEWLVVSHRFLADDWQHLEQRPAPNKANYPLMGPGPSWGAAPNIVPTQSMLFVAWYQPFKDQKEFWDLLDFDLGTGNIRDAIENPNPAFPP